MKLSFFKKKAPEKKFENTLKKYQEAAEQSPGDIRIHIKIAELYLEYGKKDKAVEEYLLAAKGYQDKNLPQIVVAIYNNIISIDPEQVDVYTKLAEIHLKNDFVGDCVAMLEKLANHYYKKDMKYEATQVLKKISEIDPDNKFFKIKVAKFYEDKNLSDSDTATEGPKDKWELIDEKKVKKPVDEISPVSFFDLEASLKDSESINISISSVEEETAAKGTSGEKVSPDDIFEELKASMEASPGHGSPEFHYNLGLAYQRSNQLEEASDEFQAALDGLENKVECCIKLAECSMALNRLDEAQDVIGKGLKFDSLTDEEKLDLIYHSGLIYKAKGDKKKALKVFKKIYETNKNFKQVIKEIRELS